MVDEHTFTYGVYVENRLNERNKDGSYRYNIYDAMGIKSENKPINPGLFMSRGSPVLYVKSGGNGQ